MASAVSALSIPSSLALSTRQRKAPNVADSSFFGARLTARAPQATSSNLCRVPPSNRFTIRSQAVATPSMSAGMGAAGAAAEQPGANGNWWERRAPPNMRHVATTEEFVEALSEAGDKLVVAEFFGTWCRSCRSMHPKMCQLATQFKHVVFLQVEFDANKSLCRSLGVRQLPFFHFYRGADGRLDAFAATLTSIAKVRAALEIHSTDRCSLGPPAGPQQVMRPDEALPPSAAAEAAGEGAAAAAAAATAKSGSNRGMRAAAA